MSDGFLSFWVAVMWALFIAIEWNHKTHSKKQRVFWIVVGFISLMWNTAAVFYAF